ncbi:TPA: two pore domain potassium channel family protein [Candidatus Micrarchaeota archaeon]|nr:two pore domain potassium channel family protein [Candidatus Micrarchaeota archaeon]
MASFREIRRNLIWSIILIFVIYAVGSLFYQAFEGWNLLDSIYFITMTISTVGYGDLVPKTEVGKIFTMVLVWVGISVAFFFIYSLAAYRESTVDRHVVEKLRMLKNITTARRSFTKKAPGSVKAIKKMLGEV